MTIRTGVLGAALSLVATGLGGLSFCLPARAGNPGVTRVTLTAFSLQPSGILIGMHPTTARITISADAAAPLAVCQFNTSFAGHWKGGCRQLRDRPLELPSSGGGLHVGFWIRPLNGRQTRVVALRLSWHCVDHYFGLVRGKTRVRSARPSFDC
jgi:hypothetical protein